MKDAHVLAAASLLSILLTTIHLTHDIVVGIDRGGLEMAWVPPVLALWAYATLALGERRSAYVVVLVMSLLASGLPVIHMTGRSGIIGVSARSAGALGAFFFGWTLIAVGVTGPLGVLLSARGLWRLTRERWRTRLRAPAAPSPSVDLASAP